MPRQARRRSTRRDFRRVKRQRSIILKDFYLIFLTVNITQLRSVRKFHSGISSSRGIRHDEDTNVVFLNSRVIVRSIRVPDFTIQRDRDFEKFEVSS